MCEKSFCRKTLFNFPPPPPCPTREMKSVTVDCCLLLHWPTTLANITCCDPDIWHAGRDHIVVPGVMNSRGRSRSPMRLGLASLVPGLARTCRTSSWSSSRISDLPGVSNLSRLVVRLRHSGSETPGSLMPSDIRTPKDITPFLCVFIA